MVQIAQRIQNAVLPIFGLGFHSFAMRTLTTVRLRLGENVSSCLFDMSLMTAATAEGFYSVMTTRNVATLLFDFYKKLT